MYGCEQQTARGLSFIAQSEQTMDEKRVGVQYIVHEQYVCRRANVRL
jgi:hypothetical protein